MRPKNCKLKPEVRWILLGCNNTDKICKKECEYKDREVEKMQSKKFWKLWVK